jgi:nitroimidazol reductase NimA-like FMN-containing flavoprotein (pyridoxamine 5'-phosphate oxidase superfamily)
LIGNDKEIVMEREQTVGILGELSKDECLELLAGREVGRIAVVAEGQPLIFPVNYVLDGDLIVFRTDPGTKLDHASLDRVAFEVDEIDPTHHEGWSVVVVGTGREITGALDRASEREQSLPLQPWASGPKEHWIRIVAPAITGRRLHRSSSLPRSGDEQSIVNLELTDEQATDLKELLEASLGDMSSEIADTDNPRFRESLMRRRDQLSDVATRLALATDVKQASIAISSPDRQ